MNNNKESVFDSCTIIGIMFGMPTLMLVLILIMVHYAPKHQQPTTNVVITNQIDVLPNWPTEIDH